MDSVAQFASRIKAKYPDYQDVPDQELVSRIVAKYPEYKDSVDMSTPAQPQGAEKPSLFQQGLQAFGSGLQTFGETVDRVAPVGAAMRSGISAAQDVATSPEGLNKSTLSQLPEGLAAAAQAFGKQYLKDPNLAPTVSQILERAGLSGVRAPRMKQNSLGQWVPGIPNAERQQDGRNPDGSIKYVGPDQGAYPSQADVIGMLAQIAVPLGIPGWGAVKGLGAAGSGVMNMAGKTAAATGKAADFAAKAADAATGTAAASRTVNAAKSGLKASAEGFSSLGQALKARYGSKLAPDATESIRVAAKNGIDPKLLPESVMFGPQSSASRLARAEAESPMGQALRDRHKAAHLAIQDAIRSDIRKIAGETKDAGGAVTKEADIPANAQEAGSLIKTAYDAKVEKTLGDMDVTYGSLAKQAPDAKIPPSAMKNLNAHLNELEKAATDLGVNSFDDVTEAQAKHLLKTVERVRARGDGFATVTQGMQGLGRTAFKVKTPLGQTPPDLQKIRALYGKLSETVTDAAGAHFGTEVADKLRANNKAITELYGDKALIPSLGDAAKSEDKLFQSLVLSGDSKRINTLKKYLSPEELQRVKGATLDLLNKESIQGEFTFRNALGKRLANPNDAFNALFNPGELDNLKDLYRLGDKLGPAELSTSGTGGSLAHQATAWSDWIRPTKLADKAEAGADKFARAKQKAKATRAMGFEMEAPKRAAAQQGRPPATMGLAPGNMQDLAKWMKLDPRKKAAQAYSQQREKK